MNSVKTLIILCFLALAACSPKSVLQTDNGQTIDLSGKWTRTDAQIVADQLYNKMLKSEWLKKFLSQNNYRPTVLVESFTNDFDESLVNDQLKNIFAGLLKDSRQFDLITSDDTSIPYFLLKGKLLSEPFELNGESGINYRLNLYLVSTEGERVWNDDETVKKFIKN